MIMHVHCHCHRYDVEFERAYLEKMRSKLGLVQKQLPDDRSVTSGS